MSSSIDASWSDELNLNEEEYGNPFLTQANIDFLSKFYKLKTIKIDLMCDGKLDVTGFFFLKTVGHRTHIFSGGRFGFLGFSEFSGHNNLETYLPAIEKCLETLNPASYCITGSYLSRKNPIETLPAWKFSQISYLVADVAESVDETGLKFRKAKIRSKLSRNLKKAKTYGNICRVTSEERDFDEWYNNCHLVRISELDGRIWDYKLLLDLVKFGSAQLAVVEGTDGKIIGGCIFLYSTKILELFMMSTPKAHLESGVNYILTEYLYKFSFKNNCKFINWQASNPPVGSLVDYKKSWNCLEMSFPVYSRINDPILGKQYFEENFKDCYVFPFEHL